MGNEFGAFLTLVIQAVVAAALPVLLAFAVAWVNKKVAEAKTKLTKEQLYLAQTGIRIFVEAAEQSGLWKTALDTGAKKKAWVLAQATDWCATHGVPIDLPAIDAQIEALVRELKWDEPPAAPGMSEDEAKALATKAYEAGAKAAMKVQAAAAKKANELEF